MTHLCYFGCGNKLENKFDFREIEGWDWFCGYGKAPLHFCPDCRKLRQPDVDKIKTALGVEPEGYPKVFAIVPEGLLR